MPLSSPALAIVTALLAAAIFAVDTFVPLGMAIAVLYAVVVLLSSRFLDTRGLPLVALGCAALTIIGFLIVHGANPTGTPLLRLLVSLAAIATTTFLAIEDRAATAALREKAGLLDLSHDGIFVRDANDVIVYWNRGAEQVYGWKAEEVVGKAVAHELLHTAFPAPRDRIMPELLKTGRWEGELVHTRADGTRMVVSSRWTVQLDDRGKLRAILQTNNDVTEQKRATEALRESEEQWREVFEHNPVMYFMVDAGGAVLSVNSFGATQLGYSVSELIGRSVLEVFQEEDREFMRQNLAGCVAAPGQSHSWEVRKVRKDGSTLWVRENAKAVRRPGDRIIVLVACEDITERRRQDDRLRRSEAYLTEAQRLSQVGSFGWHGVGSMFWSDETYRIFGLDPAVAPSLALALERTHPEDRAELRQTIENATRTGGDFDHEYRLLMPDGSTKHLHLVVRRSQDFAGEPEFVGAVMDVTAAKEAEGRMLQIIDTVPAFIWRARPDGTVDYHSRRALQYFGLTSEAALGAGPSQVHPDDRLQATEDWRAALAERKPYQSAHRLRRFDGEYRWFLNQGVPLLDATGNVEAWYGNATDIHPRKLAEDALLKAQADLAHVTRVTTLGELSASIAHEVNQPLAAVVTNGEVSLRLLDSEAPDLSEIRDALEAIVGDARRASDIIRRLRTLSMKAETQKAEVNINDLITEVVPLVRDEVLGKQVALSLELAPELPAVLADRVQLQQVVINLVVNAMDAMCSIGGTTRQLAIRSQRHGDTEVLIAVRDTGIGIDPQNARDIFDAFYTTKANGMGMGLSICRSIVESHGGTIWASANYGPGATVQFTLPAQVEPAA
jgi:PAS domain S-box-containing protein